LEARQHREGTSQQPGHRRYYPVRNTSKRFLRQGDQLVDRAVVGTPGGRDWDAVDAAAARSTTAPE
jgi:hypothetical protein